MVYTSAACDYKYEEWEVNSLLCQLYACHHSLGIFKLNTLDYFTASFTIDMH